MLGLLLLVYQMQKEAQWTIEELQAALPEPIKSIQSLPIPFDYVWSFPSVVGDVVEWPAGRRCIHPRCDKSAEDRSFVCSAHADVTECLHLPKQNLTKCVKTVVGGTGLCGVHGRKKRKKQIEAEVRSKLYGPSHDEDEEDEEVEEDEEENDEEGTYVFVFHIRIHIHTLTHIHAHTRSHTCTRAHTNINAPS
jgi:hypothetical protein